MGAALVIVVYVVLDDTKDGEVNDHDHQCKNPCEGRDGRANQGSDHAGAAAGEKGNKS